MTPAPLSTLLEVQGIGHRPGEPAGPPHTFPREPRSWKRIISDFFATLVFWAITIIIIVLVGVATFWVTSFFPIF